jgi:HK97 family phage prohead protease
MSEVDLESGTAATGYSVGSSYLTGLTGVNGMSDERVVDDNEIQQGRSDPMTDETIEDEALLQRPPRDNLVRSVMPGVELRQDENDRLPTMTGHFAVFNEWTEIESSYEGRFMERIEAGAFKRTFDVKRDKIRVLFQHGQDPQIGDKPLGRVSSLEEDSTGAYYEVPLLNTSYNRDLLPGLEAGLYGASFRFRVMKDDFNKRAKASDHNPEGLPERTIQEADVMEFGPVTFPAYAGASAGVRSETDDYMRRLLVPEFDEIRDLLKSLQNPALPVGPEAPHSDAGTRTVVLAPKSPKFRTREEFLAWTQRI